MLHCRCGIAIAASLAGRQAPRWVVGQEDDETRQGKASKERKGRKEGRYRRKEGTEGFGM
jgi:hypothetical protein